MKRRRIGALLAACAMLLTFAGTTLATTGGQTAWEGNGYPIQVNCSDTAPGEVLWVFTGDSSPDAPVLHLLGQTYTGIQNGNGSWHIFSPWFDAAPTGAYVTWSGTWAHSDHFVLTISHGCPGTTTTTTSSTTTTTTPTTTTTSTTTTPTTTTTSSVTTTSSNSTTSTVSTETTETSLTTQLTQTTSTPQGSVEAETGKPVVTPPSTDAIGAASSTPSGAWNIVLALGAVLSLSILVLTPMAKSRRRK